MSAPPGNNHAHVGAELKWKELYESIHYLSEYDMWHDLYFVLRMSTIRIAKYLGYGTETVRRRLVKAGIKRRPPVGVKKEKMYGGNK